MWHIIVVIRFGFRARFGSGRNNETEATCVVAKSSATAEQKRYLIQNRTFIQSNQILKRFII
jgi:chaperonin GroEL (HSP60 family)